MIRPATPQAPLFVWHESHAVDELRARRADVLQRIDSLPPRSYRAVELRAELRAVTRTILELELTIRRGGCAMTAYRSLRLNHQVFNTCASGPVFVGSNIAYLKVRSIREKLQLLTIEHIDMLMKLAAGLDILHFYAKDISSSCKSKTVYFPLWAFFRKRFNACQMAHKILLLLILRLRIAPNSELPDQPDKKRSKNPFHLFPLYWTAAIYATPPELESGAS